MKKKDIQASSEDPYIWEIARIKREGELDGLRAHMRRMQHLIAQEAWNNTERGTHYKGLRIAITKVEHKLKNMLMLLAEMEKIDPNND